MTYKIISRDVTLQSGDVVTKYYVEYSGGVFDGLVEFYGLSFNAPQTSIRDGYEEEKPEGYDARTEANYYKVRAEAGQALVNEITNGLLVELKTGKRSLQDTMVIEAALDGVISSLNFGQLLTAKFKVMQVSGIDANLLSTIRYSINQLCVVHYA